MNNKKGFTIIEVLAVITILGILLSLAMLAYTKYRKKADASDLLNLHSTIETSYNNYRINTITSGNILLDNIVISDDSSEDEKKFVNDYLSSLSYSGSHLNKNELNGSSITLITKGLVLNNSDYQLDAEKRALELGRTKEDIFVIDSTCKVKSEIQNNEIVKTCETSEVLNETHYAPSIDELACIKVVYKGVELINDFSNTKSFNKLCQYLID